MTRQRLDRSRLAELAPSIKQPGNRVLDAGVGIVHLGIGAFHRAHQAVYTEDAMQAKGGDWRICGVSLRGTEVRDRLRPQDFLYTVIDRSDGADAVRIIGAVAEVLYGPDDPAAVISAIARQTIHVVSLTVTEKGYCHDPATGSLRRDLPDIVNDLDMAKPPRSALGYLVRGLKARMDAGAGPVNVISCDNLPDNGRLLEGLVRDFCATAAPELGNWLDAHVAFPCTMIDRIVPAATADGLALAAASLGLDDQAALLTEPFRQWVIEDKFTAPRPAWEAAGAQIVSNVAAYEAIKLRLLNASHSAIAYLGYLGGFKTVAEAIAVPAMHAFVRQLMDEEATPTLEIPPSFDVDTYKDNLVARFANPTLAHKTWQIAMDGSQKLPQRLLETLYHNIRAGKATGAVSLAVAAWMQYVGGVDEQGQAIDVSDPFAEQLAAIHTKARGDVIGIVSGMLAMEPIFGAAEAQPPGLEIILIDALNQLRTHGALYCVANYC
ncbi:MAG: mannitol dehydrogenase family protein [Rhodospirillales bacterium]|nr:mannitol dehydrogenase family protein [Rhodospirillales bacterium]